MTDAGTPPADAAPQAPQAPGPDPGPRSARRRDPRATLALAGFGVAAFVAGSLLLPGIPTLWSVLVSMYGLILLPSLLIARRLPFPLTEVLRLRLPPAGAMAAAAALSMPASLIAALLFYAQSRIFPVPPYLEEIFQGLLRSIEARPVLGLFAVAVSPGICEEVLFRGLVLFLLERAVGRGWSIALSGMLFGIFHMEPHRFLVTAGLGALLAYMTLRSRTLFPAMALHSLYNLWICLPPMLGREWAEQALAQPWVVPLNAALLLGGVALLRRGGTG